MSTPALALIPSSGAGEIVGDPQPLVPSGVYRLKLTRWSTSMLFARQPKVVYWLSIADFGPHLGVEIPRYYNVRKLKGRAGPSGAFQVGRQSDLLREYAKLAPLPARLDRINPDQLKSLLIVGLVETVTSDRTQQELPKCLQYSVVRRLIAVEAGHATETSLVSPAPRPTPAPTKDSLQRKLPSGFGKYRHG